LEIFLGSGMSAPKAGLEHVIRTATIRTKGQGFYRLGAELARCLKEMKAHNGLLNVFLAHTSASLCIQENADPDVLLDLADALERIAPEQGPYRHRSEGPDDMPAHIKTLITASSLSLPVREGKIALGTWQEVYLIEHRVAAHARRLEMDFLGNIAI
jgi:secondary thiamine-phosphate synthase enzyme